MLVDPSFVGASPQLVATLLAHEGAHVAAVVDGTAAREEARLGAVEACHADELRATLAELRVWHALTGAAAMALTHPYARGLAVEWARYQRNPAGYAASLRAE